MNQSEQLVQLKRWQSDVEEREAAVCPEDVPFDEYIQSLWKALRPFAQMYLSDADPNEAVLCRNGTMLLNLDFERAARLAPPVDQPRGDQ